MSTEIEGVGGMGTTPGERAQRVLSYNELLVLQSLAHGCRYGFEAMALTGLSAGTVYPILRRSEAARWLRSEREEEAAARAEGRPPRRLYEVTDAGREALAAARRAMVARHQALGLIPDTR